MKLSAFTLRVLSAMAILTAASWSMSAVAQTAAPANSAASAPGPVERAENATKKAVKATKKGAKKAADAVTRTGKKIDAKIPRTEAYKKSQEDQAKPATDAK
ncbi:MAG: hypothetical protein Q7T78_02945 [Rhodoferax sp.]|nr:hypothetical protein [Rhodoferax sp.]